MVDNITLVITSINKPNYVIKRLYNICKENNVKFLIIGDKKTPTYKKKYPLVSINNQKKLEFKLAKLLPENSYSRKNLGYLLAAKSKSNIIIETDDDNYPLENFFINLSKKKKIKLVKGKKWINIYSLFSKNNDKIWPRGFPLDEINRNNIVSIKNEIVFSPIQQRMCEGNPDVDAIFRLTKEYKYIKFKKRISFSIENNCLCPFNSQNTVWHSETFPLLYLPSYCTMRATDIWRSFVALRIMRTYKWKLSFSESTAIQYRNVHNLINDFRLEYEVYRDTKIFNDVLIKVNLSNNKKDILINVLKCYEALVNNKILDKKELDLVFAWLEDIHHFFTNLQKV
jgi:hypothetical protein